MVKDVVIASMHVGQAVENMRDVVETMPDCKEKYQMLARIEIMEELSESIFMTNLEIGDKITLLFYEAAR